ncbi:uncharacterized protein LOC128224648 [Mya arenaria]|uniref:uncharacterized protein LOC128224648 n=1 Tax=Mya arenaria TaxID=6604 RepID=UPI0022E2B81B|nr:uncharacterized protein LOC128224648 [Mya arenaria]
MAHAHEQDIVLTSRSKRVSFQENTQESFQKDHNGVEISELFPSMMPKSILRRSLSPHSDQAGILKKPRKHRRKKVLQDENAQKQKEIRQFLPDKRPTESLVHALLRAMTHNEPRFKSRKLIPPKLVMLDSRRKIDDDKSSTRSYSTQLSVSSTPRQLPSILIGNRTDLPRTSLERTPALPEITSTPRADVTAVHFDRICGLCKRTSLDHQKQKPAAGFCKYCDKFLCAKCVVAHKRKLTKVHSVVVFYCEVCKEMNIISKRGSGYCVKCKHFFCSVCVIEHCAKNEHDVLEGHDVIDVINVMIGK